MTLMRTWMARKMLMTSYNFIYPLHECPRSGGYYGLVLVDIVTVLIGGTTFIKCLQNVCTMDARLKCRVIHLVARCLV